MTSFFLQASLLGGVSEVTELLARFILCCSEHIEVIIGVVGFNIGIGMSSALGMIIGMGMEKWKESVECGLG